MPQPPNFVCMDISLFSGAYAGAAQFATISLRHPFCQRFIILYPFRCYLFANQHRGDNLSLPLPSGISSLSPILNIILFCFSPKFKNKTKNKTIVVYHPKFLTAFWPRIIAFPILFSRQFLRVETRKVFVKRTPCITFSTTTKTLRTESQIGVYFL